MLLGKKRYVPGLQVLIGCILGLLFVLAIALRVSLYHIETSDYTVFLSQWYDFIQTHGGFAAFKYNFSNYNVPYLYLLTLATYIPIPKIVAIKAISVLFDVLMGIFAYLILSLKYRRSYAAVIGVLVILFAPTIFINSAAWGQSDAIYTAFCLGSLYFLLKERPAWACFFFGLAISFKLQAIFFLPALLMLLLKRKLPMRYLVLVPAVFVLMLLPAFIAGRDASSLLTIYAGQVASGGVGGAGQFNNGGGGPFNGGRPGQFNGGASGPFNSGGVGRFNGGPGGGSFSSSSLTLNAPSFYQWLPANAPEYWKWIGIGLAALFVVLVGVLLLASKKRLTSAIILKVTLVFALAIPFLLPEMHERYFYLADVLSIIYAFYFPRYFYVALIMQLCSLLSYAPYLMNTQVVNLAYIAFGVLIIIVITLVDLVLTLFPGIQTRIAVVNTSLKRD
ncbi:MAG TPA: glycosyltransferase 87 family protein [Ktedonobacteraceae bacterium]